MEIKIQHGTIDLNSPTQDAPVLYAPCSVDDVAHRDVSLVVVRRPVLRSFTGRGYGHVDERLCINVEAYVAGGPREVVGIDEAGDSMHGRRAPITTMRVWCSRNDRDVWDVATGGEPGKPHIGSTGPASQYVTDDAAALVGAIRRAQMAIAAWPTRSAAS